MIKAVLKNDVFGTRDEDILGEAGDTVQILSRLVIKETDEFWLCFVYYNVEKDRNDIANIVLFNFSEEEIETLPVIGYKEKWDELYREWKEKKKSKKFLLKYKIPIEEITKETLNTIKDFVSPNIKKETAMEFLKSKGIEKEDTIDIINRII